MLGILEKKGLITGQEGPVDFTEVPGFFLVSLEVAQKKMKSPEVITDRERAFSLGFERTGERPGKNRNFFKLCRRSSQGGLKSPARSPRSPAPPLPRPGRKGTAFPSGPRGGLNIQS